MTSPSLSQFIVANTKQIVADWEAFARGALPDGSVEERRDHIEGMLEAIALDLDQPQTKKEQAAKSRGQDDSRIGTDTAANAHGIDRAADGYSPVEMVSEFRALRASVLRHWSESGATFSVKNREDVARFNEAIDQLLAESICTYAHDIDKAKDLFLGVLGHDLRNPLGAITATAAVMIRKEGPEWPHLRNAARILASATRMDAMISYLVDFTRTRLGSGIPLVRVDTDLEKVCRHAVDEITAFHPKCVVRFEARGGLRGQWDSERIAQTVSNLVGNAYQHGLEDEPIEVSLHGNTDEVVLTVRNQGPVIPKSQLKEMFNPFRQLEPRHSKAKEARSLGLGLYIVQGIVRAHHGSVDVASTKSGTTFTVRLPRTIAPS